MSYEIEKFEIEVEQAGEIHVFPAELRTMGYTFKIAVDLFGSEILFEPDEERNFRAVIDREKYPNISFNADILQKIAQFLEEVFK